MILAVDVDYQKNIASVGGLTFNSWNDRQESGIYRSCLSEIEEYVPGQFYKRELPCILRLLEEHQLQPKCIVVDGFVFLDGTNTHGLGWYLYDALCRKTSIIGVAKNTFKGIPDNYRIYRGSSKNPLYVTAVGVELKTAQNFIKSMHGTYRLPTLLKKVDQICRGIK